MKYIDKKKWFTLIEIMIVISIVWMMMAMAHAPYSYFQKKIELKVAAKQIAKTLSESRSMAIHWINVWNKNQSIWVYFDKTKKNIIEIYSYDCNDVSNRTKLKEIKIEQNIQVDKISGKNTMLFFFNSITGDGKFFEKLDLTNEVIENKINIEFSYKWASRSVLQRNIEYYTKTYISDY